MFRSGVAIARFSRSRFRRIEVIAFGLVVAKTARSTPLNSQGTTTYEGFSSTGYGRLLRRIAIDKIDECTPRAM